MVLSNFHFFIFVSRWCFVYLNWNCLLFSLRCCVYFPVAFQGPSWSCGSWIYNYMCNQCLSPLTWIWNPLSRGVLHTTLCDQVCSILWYPVLIELVLNLSLICCVFSFKEVHKTREFQYKIREVWPFKNMFLSSHHQVKPFSQSRI